MACSARRPGSSQLRLALRLAGAGLLIAAGAIHLDLNLTGYRSIPVIGWLFLFQVIAAFVLAVVELASGSRLAAAAGAGFAVATPGGYLLSIWIGLFGFKEVRTTAGIVASLIEVAAFAVLAVLAAAPDPGGQPAGATAPDNALLARLQAGVPGVGLAVAGLSLVALAPLGIGFARAGSPATSASAAGAEVGAYGRYAGDPSQAKPRAGVLPRRLKAGLEQQRNGQWRQRAEDRLGYRRRPFGQSELRGGRMEDLPRA